MDFVIRPHLLSDRDAEHLEVPAGTSLAQMVSAFPWPTGVINQVVVLVNGEMMPRAWWGRIRPKQGALVLVTVRLEGGQKSKGILALVAAIAITVTAPYLAELAVGQIGWTTAGAGYKAIVAGIAVLGNLAISAIFKPPPVRTAAAENFEVSNAYSFGGQSNPARPYGPILKVYGRHRVYPDICAAPYTTVEGDNNYFTGIYSFGYSPLLIEDIRIGTTSIWNYKDVQIKIHDQYLAGQPLDFYKTDVWQDGYSLTLVQWVPTVITTRPETDSAQIDIAYLKGLGYFNDRGGIEGRMSSQTIYFKETTSGTWQPLGNYAWVSISEGGLNNWYTGQLQAEYITDIGWAFPAGKRYGFAAKWDNAVFPSPGSWINIAGFYATVESANANILNLTEGLPYTIRYSKPYSGGWVPVTSAHPQLDTWYVWRATASPFVVALHIGFPYKARWDIKIEQIDDVPTDTRYAGQRAIVAVKSFASGVAPVAPDVPVTLMEIRIKATDQLSGTLDNLNAVATSVLPGWNGETFEYKATRNPAEIFLDLLRGPANKRPIPDSRIDFATIKRWKERNERIETGFSQPNAYCDFVVDKSYTLWELLSSVASNGRAMPTMKDNKYSVIIDEENLTPVQTFTPRNSWGLTSQKAFLDIPHGLRVKWIDPSADYKQADGIVYSPGYNLSNATVFEEYQTFGITTWEQAIREGRVTLARGMLQQEQFNLSTDIENIICTRGDLVYVVHDVLKVGGWSARIEAINGLNVTLDSDMKMFEDPFGVRFRSDQAVISNVIAATVVDNRTLGCASVPSTAKVGDLILYGTTGKVEGKYFVKAVRPGKDLTAQIDFIEYAPGIYDAERGTIPPYIPQPGSTESFTPQPVRNLTARVIAWIDKRIPKADAYLQWDVPDTRGFLPSYYLIYQIFPDGTRTEVGRASDTSFQVLAGVETWKEPFYGASIPYEVVPVWPGYQGPAAGVSVQLPADTIRNPDPLASVSAEVLARTVRVSWPASADPYLEFYVIRYGPAGSTWDDNAATERKIKANTIDLGAIFLAGDWLVFAAMEDIYGLRSSDVSGAFTIERPKQVPVAGNSVGNTAFLRWGTLTGTVSGEWTAQTSFQIEYYEIVKSKLAAAYLRKGSSKPFRLPHSLGVIQPETFAKIESRASKAAPVYVGKYSGEFAVLDEQQPGEWEYCIAGVDYAGNRADPACLILTLAPPDNYFLLDQIDNLLPEPETTETNVADSGVPFNWIAPVNTTETWTQHFAGPGWQTINDQIAAGFPIYAQPANTTPALVSWEYDYINPLPPLMVSADATYDVLAPAPTVTMRLWAKLSGGTTWILMQQAQDSASSLLPANTRYVKVDTEVATSPDKKGLVLLTNVSYRIDVKYKDDSGIATTAADGQAVVVFNVDFVDIRGVSITSMDANITYGRAIIAFDQQSMTVYTFGATGLPAGGKFSWIVKGV